MKKFLYIAIFLHFSVGVILADNGIKIGQNYPNPAKEKTFVNIEFDAPEAQLVLANILGETIQVIQLPHSGTYTINVTDIPEGIYFYTVEAGGQKITKKLTVKK